MSTVAVVVLGNYMYRNPTPNTVPKRRVKMCVQQQLLALSPGRPVVVSSRWMAMSRISIFDRQYRYTPPPCSRLQYGTHRQWAPQR